MGSNIYWFVSVTSYRQCFSRVQLLVWEPPTWPPEGMLVPTILNKSSEKLRLKKMSCVSCSCQLKSSSCILKQYSPLIDFYQCFFLLALICLYSYLMNSNLSWRIFFCLLSLKLSLALKLDPLDATFTVKQNLMLYTLEFTIVDARRCILFNSLTLHTITYHISVLW